MAKQKGLLKFIGSIGNLTFYQKDGEYLVKKKSTLGKVQVFESPEFERSRENMSEFGASAKMAKSFRNIFAANHIAMGKPVLSGRVTALMSQLVKKGSGVRGQRAFEILAHKNMLEGFEFIQNRSLDTVFFAPFILESSAESRTSVKLTIPVFNTKTCIRAPKGTTHFKMVLHAGILSNFTYDEKYKGYTAVAPELHEKNDLLFTEEILLSGNTARPIGLALHLNAEQVLPDTAALIVALGIFFYQENNNVFYPMANSCAMRVLRVG